MQERIIYLKYQSKKSFFVFPRLDKELRIRYSCKDSAFLFIFQIFASKHYFFKINGKKFGGIKIFP